MSRVGTMVRNQMVRGLGDAAKMAPCGDLNRRLDAVGLEMSTMEGDGNCQFRALAFNLFGSQSHYAIVRECVCAHMQAHADFFGIFFDGEAEFESYLIGDPLLALLLPDSHSPWSF